MNRQEITNSIDVKKKQIEELRDEIRELRIQDLLLCDEEQQYYEEEVQVTLSKRPKKVEKQLHGFIKWKETFYDVHPTGTKEPFEVERNMLVRVNGEWL